MSLPSKWNSVHASINVLFAILPLFFDKAHVSLLYFQQICLGMQLLLPIQPGNPRNLPVTTVGNEQDSIIVYIRYLTQVTYVTPKFSAVFPRRFPWKSARTSTVWPHPFRVLPARILRKALQRVCALQTALIPDDVGKFFRILEH